MKKLKYLLIVCCFLISCKKDGINNQSIVGQWQWIQTYAGISGIIYTPQNTGKTGSIIFNTNLTYSSSGNGIFNTSGNYRLSVYSAAKFLTLSSSTDTILYQYSISNDTLNFGNLFVDGAGYTFVRR